MDGLGGGQAYIFIIRLCSKKPRKECVYIVHCVFPSFFSITPFCKLCISSGDTPKCECHFECVQMRTQDAISAWYFNVKTNLSIWAQKQCFKGGERRRGDVPRKPKTIFSKAQMFHTWVLCELFFVLERLQRKHRYSLLSLSIYCVWYETNLFSGSTCK